MAGSYRLWFRITYNLPPTDPRYLAATDEQIETEWWAHQFHNGKIGDEIEDEDFDLDAVLAEINAEGEAKEAERNLASGTMRSITDTVIPPPIDGSDIDDWEEV